MPLNVSDPEEYASYRRVITHPIFFVFGGLYLAVIFAWIFIASRPEEEEYKNRKPKRITRRDRAPAKQDTLHRRMEGLFVPKLSARDFKFGREDLSTGSGLSTVIENPTTTVSTENLVRMTEK